MIWTDGEEGQNGTWNEEHDIYERGKGKKEDGQKFIQSIYLSIYLSVGHLYPFIHHVRGVDLVDLRGIVVGCLSR
jgi:hypothetical protein